MHASGNDAPHRRPREGPHGFSWARLAPVLALLALSSAPAGCIAAGAAAGATVGVAAGDAAARHDSARYAGTAVAVAFARARDVAMVGSAGGDTTRVRGAVALLGRVTATRGDTLRLAVSEGRGSDGAASFPSGREPTTEIVPGPEVSVRVLSRAPTQTNAAFTGALIGIIVAVTIGIVAWVIACSGNSCAGG